MSFVEGDRSMPCRSGVFMGAAGSIIDGASGSRCPRLFANVSRMMDFAPGPVKQAGAVGAARRPGMQTHGARCDFNEIQKGNR